MLSIFKGLIDDLEQVLNICIDACMNADCRFSFRRDNVQFIAVRAHVIEVKFKLVRLYIKSLPRSSQVFDPHSEVRLTIAVGNGGRIVYSRQNNTRAGHHVLEQQR